MTTRRHDRESAFTLVELLVVIGVIGLLLGGIGLALGRGDKSTALQAGQNTLASLFGAVRGRAALAQSDAALVVDVKPGSDGFLHTFRIAVKNSSNTWDMVGSPVSLPTGIYLVPRSTGTTYSGGVEFGDDWSGSSSLGSTGIEGVSIELTNDRTSDFVLVLTLSRRGTTNDAGQLVLSPAEVVDADTIRFANPALVRGAKVSEYGVLTLINEADAFND